MSTKSYCTEHFRPSKISCCSGMAVVTKGRVLQEEMMLIFWMAYWTIFATSTTSSIARGENVSADEIPTAI